MKSTPGNLSADNVTWTTTLSPAPMNMSFLAGVPDYRPKDSSGFPGFAHVPNYAYGATRAKALAVLHTQLPYDTANNAESYALYAQARYIMARKGFYPKDPTLASTNTAQLLVDPKVQQGDDTDDNQVCLGTIDTV